MSRAAATAHQRMPTSDPHASTSRDTCADQRSGYRTSSSDDMDNDNTNSSYNGRAYPTSEAHLTRSAEDEYAYSMAQYASHAQRRGQPSFPSPIHSPEGVGLPASSSQYAAYSAYGGNNQRSAGGTYDKSEYASPPLSELDTHNAVSETHPTLIYSDKSAPYSTDNAHAYGQSDKGWTARSRQQSSNKQPAMGGAGAAGEGVSSIVRGYGTPHQIAYLSVVLLQTLATAAMIAIVWVKIRAGTPLGYNGFNSFFSGADDGPSLRRRTITVYLAIFLFGSVFEIITAIDALRLNNTIQLIGVCLFVVAMMVYAALLDGQVENAISIEDGYSANLYAEVRPYIIAMPIIQGVAALVLAYFTYKLFRDFGWEVLHLIGADRKMKRMYTKYQIFVCLVKFDFFFFVGFSLQYMILVLKVQEAEFIITIIAFPFTVLALVLAVIAVRREIKSLSYVIFIAELCALAYFIFKFFRLFQPSQAFRYQNSRKTLAVFSALAILMLLLTFWCSILCFVNYDKGLKEAIPGYFGEHRASRRQKLSRKNSNAAGAMLDERLSRMSID